MGLKILKKCNMTPSVLQLGMKGQIYDSTKLLIIRPIPSDSAFRATP